MAGNLKDDQWCFACGSQNPHGLRLSNIHLEGCECVCSFTPQKVHQGWAGILHGGITSTLLDEMMTHVLWRMGYDAVTAEMTVRLRKPIPLDEPLRVRGWIARQRGKFAETEGEVTLADGTVAATATAKFFATRRGPDTLGAPLSLAAREHAIFDLFGTLVPVFAREEYFDVLREVGEAVGMEPEAFVQAFRAGAPQRTVGKWQDLHGNLRAILADAGLPCDEDVLNRAVEMRVAYSRRQLMNPYPETLATLEALRDAGRKIGLISDCSPETAQLWPQTPLAQFIPAPVLSCVVGLRKPDPRIYHLACERMGVDPLHAVYVGDGDSNEIHGAHQVRLCPILVDRGEESAFRLTTCSDCGIIVQDLSQVLPLIGVADCVGE
jgi:putative hydrolase of the HAD superfamily